MYENSCEMIYDMISKRIFYRRDCLKKQNKDIYPEDENLISAIANNRRDEKKNKYLIPAETSRAKEPKNYVLTIASNLEFDSVNDFLWGNNHEIEAYSGQLFFQIIKDALNYEKNHIVEQIYNVLTDYIPFGLSKFYFELLQEFPEEVLKFISDEKYQVDTSTFFEERDIAIIRLYQQTKFDFITVLTNFLYNLKSTYKLNKFFSGFFKESVLPLIQRTISEDSTGSEAYLIMYRNHKRMVKVFNQELQVSPEAIGYHENESEYHSRTIAFDLLREGSKYVEALSAIQKSNEEPIEILLIENKWKPEMCI